MTKLTPSQLADAQAALAAANDGKPWQYRDPEIPPWYPGRTDICVAHYLSNGYLVRPTPAPVVKPWTCETIPAIPFGVIRKSNGNKVSVGAAGEFVIHVIWLGNVSYDDLLSSYTRNDGSPCGTTEGEG